VLTDCTSSVEEAEREAAKGKSTKAEPMGTIRTQAQPTIEQNHLESEVLEHVATSYTTTEVVGAEPTGI
jgi:hypothetical protein